LLFTISNHINNSQLLQDYTGIYQNWKRLSSNQKAKVVEILINDAQAQLNQPNVSIKSLLVSKVIDMNTLMAIINEIINNIDKQRALS
jgi:hypothetical protein